MVIKTEMDEAHLALKMSSLTRISVVYNDRLLELTGRLPVPGCLGCIFLYPLKKILERIVIRIDLRVDPCSLDFREEFL